MACDLHCCSIAEGFPRLALAAAQNTAHLHSVIPCVCSLPTKITRKSAIWRLRSCSGTDIPKFDQKSADL